MISIFATYIYIYKAFTIKLVTWHAKRRSLKRKQPTKEFDGSFPASACHRDDARRTHITQTVKDIVFQFWMDETRVSPNKKDVCSKRLARCSYVKHPIHLLEEPQVIDIFF